MHSIGSWYWFWRASTSISLISMIQRLFSLIRHSREKTFIKHPQPSSLLSRHLARAIGLGNHNPRMASGLGSHWLVDRVGTETISLRSRSTGLSIAVISKILFTMTRSCRLATYSSADPNLIVAPRQHSVKALKSEAPQISVSLSRAWREVVSYICTSIAAKAKLISFSSGLTSHLCV